MESPSQGIPRSHVSEPAKRLSLNLPESLHTRFRTACSTTNRKMMSEIQELVARRTEELEEQAGLNEWADRHQAMTFDQGFAARTGIAVLP